MCEKHELKFALEVKIKNQSYRLNNQHQWLTHWTNQAIKFI